MSQATYSLTPAMGPYDILQVVKVLDSMIEEVSEASLLYCFSLKLLLNKEKRIMFLLISPKFRALWLKTKMEEREKKEILQHMECFNRLFVVASSFVQLHYEKYILKQPCMDSKQLGETWIREIL
ncbi:hypothetical protein Godav_005410, partial [Gossypium davidsonii]|nr:hypothetical protein [Gossypium davidsonii]